MRVRGSAVNGTGAALTLLNTTGGRVCGIVCFVDGF